MPDRGATDKSHQPAGGCEVYNVLRFLSDNNAHTNLWTRCGPKRFHIGRSVDVILTKASDASDSLAKDRCSANV